MSSTIPSTKLVSSVSGLVSSSRRMQMPPKSAATPKSTTIALACPMWRYPLGSGGNLVWTRPPRFPAWTSASTAS